MGSYDVSTPRGTTIDNMLAGGPGSGRHKGYMNKDKDYNKNAASTSKELSHIHLQKEDFHTGKAEYHRDVTHNKQLQQAHEKTAAWHSNASDFFKQAAKHYENENTKQGDKQYELGRKNAANAKTSTRNTISHLTSSAPDGADDDGFLKPAKSVVKTPSFKAPKTIGHKPPMVAGGPGSGRHAVIDKYHGTFFKTVKVHDNKEDADKQAKRMNSKNKNDSHKFSVKKVV